MLLESAGIESASLNYIRSNFMITRQYSIVSEHIPRFKGTEQNRINAYRFERSSPRSVASVLPFSMAQATTMISISSFEWL